MATLVTRYDPSASRTPSCTTTAPATAVTASTAATAASSYAHRIRPTPASCATVVPVGQGTDPRSIRAAAGHIAGAILLGAALWDVIPRRAALALIVSQPLHFVAFVVLQNRYLDAATWALTAAGLAACAVAVLRTPDDEWDLPPAGPRAEPGR